MNERVETTLRFVGGWPWWAGVALALVLGAAAWLLYRRETHSARRWIALLLPLLRVLAVVLIVLMLCGPILHHRKTIGQLSRLWLFVDGSQSMELTDRSMDLGRKVAVLQQLGLLREGAVKLDLPRASAALVEARALAERARTLQGAEQWKPLIDEFNARLAAAAPALDSAKASAFARELTDPARDLAARNVERADDRTRAIADLARLGEAAKRYAAELREAFERSVRDEAANEQSALGAAMARFNSMPRWQRLQAELLAGGPKPLLADLAEHHDVQLLSLDGGAANKLWQPSAKESTLPAVLPKPTGEITNLATGPKNAASGPVTTAKAAIVLFTDGQHNEGESPVEVAKILAGRGVPIFTVGYGSETRPRDLAIAKLDAPEAVFFEDRVRGQITLKDDMPAGLPFTVAIKDGEKAVWQQQLVTDGTNLRRVTFDFPISDLVKERVKQQTTQQISGVPLELAVSISNLESDSVAQNNAASLRLRAVTQKRRILLVDGRARWESRYLRNMFERDEQWQVNAVIAGSTIEAGLPRGDRDGAFPEDLATLAGYDLIIFGEVPRDLLKDNELQMIAEFVGQRGGAIIFIDGPRDRLREYRATPLAPLFPVEWKGDGIRDGIVHLALNDRAASLAPFTLSPDLAQNAETWKNLKPPHWLSTATPLAGAETLLEAEVDGRKVPAAVYRPFGAGKVFYHAFDDSWRWRHEVADQYHVRYWNQIANWIAELPFAVRDKFVSLDAGAVTYRPGDSADLRVRLSDGKKPVTSATVDAVLYRDGVRAATIRLSPDDNAGGLFRGKTAALEPGSYEVAVESLAIPSTELKARAEFKVEPRETGELTQLSLNEDLLRQISAASGGQYLREEDLGKLASLLAPLSQGRVVESDTVLWQSYWWFVPIILLLTAEWILRKRFGML